MGESAWGPGAWNSLDVWTHWSVATTPCSMQGVDLEPTVAHPCHDSCVPCQNACLLCRSSLCWRLGCVLLCLQGEAIAYNLREMFGLRVPVISVVIGEGGSGGALAIGCANRNLIMENAVYYVASPEACAAILWKSRAAASQVGGVIAREESLTVSISNAAGNKMQMCVVIDGADEADHARCSCRRAHAVIHQFVCVCV